jgi:hypothetical protein
MALAHARGQLLPTADLYRVKGELLLGQEIKSQKAKGKGQKKFSVVSSQLSVPSPRPPIPDPQGEAEKCFLQSIEIARSQQARTLEFRAAIRLSQLWQHQGKEDRARHMLAPLYERFSGKHGSADWQEADALLRSV